MDKRFFYKNRLPESHILISDYINAYLSYMQGYFRKIRKDNSEWKQYEKLMIYLGRSICYINDKKKNIKLSDEIGFIRIYALIQTTRFKNINFEINLEKKYNGYYIKKMEIFMILEKIISRSFEYPDTKMKIEIRSGTRKRAAGIFIVPENSMMGESVFVRFIKKNTANDPIRYF